MGVYDLGYYTLRAHNFKRSLKQSNTLLMLMPIEKIKEQISKLKKDDWRNHSRRLVLRSELDRFKKSFRQNFVTLMISSLGLLVALTWSDFWKDWVSTLSAEDSMIYKFYIAISMTLLAVVLTYLFSRIKGQD